MLQRAPTSRAASLLASILAASALTLLVVNVAWVWRFTVDDSYITLRYSRHLAEGIGPIFNKSGPPAEGYTSFAWMVVLAIPHLLDISPLLLAKILGVVATLGATAVVALWVRHATRDAAEMPIAVALAVAAYATLGRTAIHAVSGMETASYTFVLITLLYTSARTIHSPTHAGYWRLALLCSLLGVSRPEGNLAACVVMLGVAMNVPTGDRTAFVRVAALGWVLPLGAYELWRLSYYGLLFPLPFYVKVASPSGLPGALPVLDWGRDVALRLGVPVVVAMAASVRDLRPALVAAAVLIVFLLLPQHLNGYEYRYLAPLDPLFSVLFGIGMARVLQTARPRPLRFGLGVALTALACGVAITQSPRSIRGRLGYADGMAAAHERLGRDLAALGFPGRVALSDAGAIPYFSEWSTLDLVGLNDVETAVTGNRDAERVLGFDPHVIVLVSGSGEEFEPVDWNAWEGPLYEAAIAGGFASVSIYRFDVDYWLWVLARPDSPEGRALALAKLNGRKRRHEWKQPRPPRSRDANRNDSLAILTSY